jgi:hypothetical protein
VDEVSFVPRLLTGNILNAIASWNWGTSFLKTMISMQLPKGSDGRSDNSDSSLTANIGDFVNPSVVEKDDGKGEADGVNPVG